MNSKQTIPAIAKIAPPLLLGVVIFSALKWIFSDDDTEKKPEIKPADAGTENNRKATVVPVVSELISVPPVPEIPAKSAIISAPSATRPFLPPFSAAKIPATQAPPPIKRKFVTRHDMETIFQRGARGLTRTAAVVALKNLGFSKTAAYDALSEDGRFSDWLQFEPDGIITWTE